MKYSVRLVPQFNRDVANLADALAPHPNMAKRIFQEMERKIDGLRDNPYGHETYHAKPKYRRMILEGHSLFYILNEDKREVSLYCVIYGKRDMEKLLED